MLKLLCGPSGSSKSETVYSSVVNDISNNKRVLLLVPEQEVLRCERILAERLDGLNSLDLEVVSFRRLCNRIFREFGGLCKNYISTAGQSVLMWRTLSELNSSLSYYSNSDPCDQAFIDRLLSFVGRMKAYKISSLKFSDCIQKLPHSLLRDKATDLSVIYQRYDALVHESFDDSAEDLEMTHSLLLENNFFGNYSVYIDSFYGFTPGEIDIIEDIFDQSENVTVSVLSGCVEGKDDYDRIKATKKKLLELAEKHFGDNYQLVDLSSTPRYTLPELAFLSKNIWNHTADPFIASVRDSITIAECPDAYTESDWIAADIKKSVRLGLRYSEIAVITRDPSKLKGILDEALELQDIPYHMSHRENISVYPLIRFILFALKIIDAGWKRSDVIGYVKTGITPISYVDVDVIENYVTMWDINGEALWNSVWSMNPSGFKEERSESDIELLDRINTIRETVCVPIYDLSQKLKGDFSAQSFAEALYAFIESSGVRSSIINDDDASIWTAVIDALDELHLCAGNVKLNVGSAASLLRNIFDHTNIGSIPSSSDEVVISGAELARVGTVKRVYLCMVNDGVFPATVKDDVLFTDRDLSDLRKAGIDIADSSDSRANDELLYFARALSCASESVCISYATADNQGKKIIASNGCKRVCDLINGIRFISAKDEDPIFLTESPRAAIRYLNEHADTAFGFALKSYFNDSDKYKDFIIDDSLPISKDESSFSDEITERVFGGDLALTQSRLEIFIGCPFKYACSYIFKIPEIRSDRYNNADIGTFVHSILEQYFKHVSKNGVITERAESVSLIDSIIDNYIKSGLGSPDSMNSRTAALFKRLRRTVIALVDDINAEFAQSDFKPSYFELGIGSNQDCKVDPISVKLSDGTNTFVYGIIDRVDTCNIGEDTYIRIVDYKTGNKSLKTTDARKGKNLQMLLYLFSICDSDNPQLKKELGCTGRFLPAGAQYYIARAPRNIIHTEDDIAKYIGEIPRANRNGFALNAPEVLSAMDKSGTGVWLPKTSEKNSNVGLVTADEFNLLDDDVREVLYNIGNTMKSGECSIYKGDSDHNDSPCRFCSYRPICRKEER